MLDMLKAMSHPHLASHLAALLLLSQMSVVNSAEAAVSVYALRTTRAHIVFFSSITIASFRHFYSLVCEQIDQSWSMFFIMLSVVCPPTFFPHLQHINTFCLFLL